MTHSSAVARAAAHAGEIGPDELARLRGRMRWVLFTVAALGSTGYIAAVTVGTLVAAEFSGGAALGGLPTTTTTIGTALAASLLARFARRRDRSRDPANRRDPGGPPRPGPVKAGRCPR